MKKSQVLLSVLILSALACNLPGAAALDTTGDLVATGIAQTVEAGLTENAASGETGTATEAAPTEEATQVATAAPSETLPPTNTAPPPTNTPLPCNSVTFVSDVTVPDGYDVYVNDTFTKTWKLRNNGSCAWNSSYKLVFKSGDQLDGPNSQQLTNSNVAPGQELNVSVDLQAPNATGSFQGFWYLQEPGGAFFELSTGPFWVKIDAVLADLPDWPIFRNGDSGPEVYAIQYLLRHHGSAIAADGAFGPQTRAAVQAFQTSKSLASDGIVGPNTWAELIKNMNVQQGANGERVKALQYLLKEKFGYSINVDGAFGPQTDAAVEDFQIDAGIISDGIVGAQTWRMLVGATP